MSEQDRAQKLAAAKRRVEQMKKKKGGVKKELDSETTKILNHSDEIPNTLSSEDASAEDPRSFGKDQIEENESIKEIKQNIETSHELEPSTLSSEKDTTQKLSSHNIFAPNDSTQEHEDSLSLDNGEKNTQSPIGKEIPFTSETEVGNYSLIKDSENKILLLEKECSDLHSRLLLIEAENIDLRLELERLRSSHKQSIEHESLVQTNNGIDNKVLKKIQELEKEISKLRGGTNTDTRETPTYEDLSGATNQGAKFTDVDLGVYSLPRRDSVPLSNKRGLSKLISNSLSVIAGINNEFEEDRILDEDELVDFDEEAFRQAREEEVKQRIERIKDTKRALKEWQGWRLDLVDIRSDVRDGVGPIFDL